ncbi:MAG: glycosyltransferase [Nitrospira sp.]|nr:glycosyltransferase [Nitrospira sp.]
MKIPAFCQLSDFGPEVAGSFVDSMLSLGKYCRQQFGVETFFIFPERAKNRKWLSRFNDGDFPVGFVSAKRNVISDVRDLLKEYDPLIFHTHFSQFDLSPLLLKFLYFRHSKVVWSYHHSLSLTTKQRIKDWVKINCLGECFVDKFVAVGDAVYAGLLNAGLPEKKIALVYNGIDVERFSLNSSRSSIRNHLDIEDGSIVFLLLGRNPFIKGLDIFLKAAEEIIRKKETSARFIIVGKEETRKVISSYIKKADGLRKVIKVINPVDDFSSLLNAVDVFVSCSRSEGFSYAVVEAMAAKKILLSSNIQIPVISGLHGKAEGILVYPTEDWKSLSELMEKFLNMETSKRMSLGSANYAYVKNYFSVEIWAKKMGKMYHDLLKN